MTDNSQPVPPPPARLTRILLTLAAVLVLAAGVLVVAERHLKGALLRALAARTGHEIRIGGALQAQLLSRQPTLTATQVTVLNPAWMPAGAVAEVGRLTVRLRWRMSLPPLQVRRLELEDTTLQLMRNAAGRANWYLSAEGPGAGPALIQSLSMPRAHVELNDERQHLKFSGFVSAGDQGDTLGSPLRIDVAGQLNGRAATVRVDAESLSSVRRERPYHFSFEAHSGATRLAGSGLLEQPFDFRRMQATFEANGPDLKDLYYLVGISLPDTGAFRAAGNLAREGTRFIYRDLTATSGASDVKGTLTLDSTDGRSRLEAQLESTTLRLADLGARAAARAPEPERAAALRVTDTPFRLGGLRRRDAHVKLRVHALQLGSQTLQSVSAVVSVDHGVLTIEKAKASLGDGTVSGDARLDSNPETPRGELNLILTGLPLEQLRGSTAQAASLHGLLSARVQLTGSGKSLHELAATANGTATAVIPRGSMRAAAAEAASLELAGALGLLLKSQKETAIRCGVASLDAHAGVLTLRSFVIDTERSLITGAGEVHMDTERLDLTVQGRPKKPELALHSPLAIRGTLSHPQLRLAGGGTAAQTGAAAALGAVLSPLAAVLGFVNPGLARDADCAALLAQAEGNKMTARAAAAAP